jgi:hypothetical protein
VRRLVVLLLLIACTTRDGATFTSPEHRYSITFPRGWTEGGAPKPGAVLYRSGDATILVIVQSNGARPGVAGPNVRTAAAYLDQRGMRTRVFDLLTIGGAQSEVLVFEGQYEDGTPINGAQVAFPHGSRDFAITLGAPPAEFDVRLAEFREALRGMRFFD